MKEGQDHYKNHLKNFIEIGLEMSWRNEGVYYT